MPDLHFNDAAATEREREAVDAARPVKGRRDLLLPVLHSINDHVGWISNGALNYACERLDVPPAEAYGVATFYAMFSTTQRAPAVVHVCDDIACACKGSEEICSALEAKYGPAGFGRAVTWLRSPCLGMCDRAPALLVSNAGSRHLERQVAPATPELATSQLWHESVPVPQARTHVGGTNLRLLHRVADGIDPENIQAYCARRGYAALRRAFEIGGEAVIDEVVASRLLGRGGAAFPAGGKLEAVAKAAAQPHYVVCNADESEPGTFKDRVLMESDPFAIVEAMTIAGFAARAERGYIYIRGEYPLATHRLQHAIDEARRNGFLGRNILQSGFAFEIEIRRGAGAYICGEETALFNSIEGKRGEPRSKPPFPVQVGLFGKPTLVNNVETLANFLPILLEGGDAYASVGSEGSTGTRLFSLSGCVAQPGIYEVPHGTMLQDVLELAGGVRKGGTLQTILLGGAAGTFVGPAALTMPLTFEDARAAGATLGSGVVMAFDDSSDIRATLARIARFFREESCGQCVPCRVGTVRQEEALRDGRVDLLADIGRVMRDASICGLGQTAANAIASARAVLE